MRPSLGLKLLGVHAIAFVLCIAALSLSVRLSRDPKPFQFFHTNLQEYATYLAKDIGDPPSPVRAKEIALRTGFLVSIRGPGIHFSTGDDPRRWLARVRQGGFEFRFAAPRNLEQEGWGLLIGIGLISLILSLSHWLTRRILRPIERMTEIARAYGEGKWEKRVPEAGKDELAELGRAMNDMAARIGTQFRAMRELLVGISHEFRSPLTRMRVALESVPDPVLRDSLKEEIVLLDRMTENLLERERVTARPDLLELEKTPLKPLLENIVRPYLTQGLEVDLSGPDREVVVDRQRVSLALRNLVENAFRHASKPSLKLDSEGVLELSDRGPGIPIEILGRLGEPFHHSQGGFGLGLSLAYSIFRAHGASIEARSRPGEGTSFRIRL